jgi:hypothetical protein
MIEFVTKRPRSEIGKTGLAITRMDTEPPWLRVQITGWLSWQSSPWPSTNRARAQAQHFT